MVIVVPVSDVTQGPLVLFLSIFSQTWGLIIQNNKIQKNAQVNDVVQTDKIHVYLILRYEYLIQKLGKILHCNQFLGVVFFC